MNVVQCSQMLISSCARRDKEEKAAAPRIVFMLSRHPLITESTPTIIAPCEKPKIPSNVDRVSSSC